MVNLKIPPKKAILLLNEKVDEIKTMRENHHCLEYYDFVNGCSKIWSMIDEIYRADEPHPEEIRIIGVPTCSCSSSIGVQQMLLEIYQSCLLEYIDEIQNSMKTPR